MKHECSPERPHAHRDLQLVFWVLLIAAIPGFPQQSSDQQANKTAPTPPLSKGMSEASSDPAYMGSPYVPMDSWVYPAFDRLAALGYTQTGFAGLRPWTRLQCAALLQEAVENGIIDTAEQSAARGTYKALATEFAPELGRLQGSRNVGARVESIYSRVTTIASQPLTDGFHSGQTIINDHGRPYQQGANVYTGITADSVVGPLTFYLRGEYQHAPSAPPLSAATRQLIAQEDSIPLPPNTPINSINKFDPIEAYGAINLRNWQFTFGKQDLW